MQALGMENVPVSVDELNQVHAGGKGGNIVFLPAGGFKGANLPSAEIVDHQFRNLFVVGKADIVRRRIGVYHRPEAIRTGIQSRRVGQAEKEQQKEKK